ncbi:hypothetical protein OIDMADRAFT_20746 [Oidiodendron maius Zn]|uniref:Uncharacterized protein n=1 Tax=Oidiodendron maius (strain Zn) TaxID=913774 RepID=A0A0C3CBL1_OIDMZ|nr:hypothetical protein OIDMADRAFT_20746 [Oidiodendron maius Zn]
MVYSSESVHKFYCIIWEWHGRIDMVPCDWSYDLNLGLSWSFRITAIVAFAVNVTCVLLMKELQSRLHSAFRKI